MCFVVVFVVETGFIIAYLVSGLHYLVRINKYSNNIIH